MDYDLEIHYHPGKANLFADALSQKEHVHATIATQLPNELAEDFKMLNLGIVAHAERFFNIDFLKTNPGRAYCGLIRYVYG